MSQILLKISPVNTQQAPSFKTFLGPKYWPTWLGIALLAIVAFCPFKLRLFFGALLGRLLYLLAKERRYITATNISLCFPELSESAQRALVLDCFIENGRGLIDTAVGWIREPQQFQSLLRVINREYLEKALAEGKGVILLGAHYTTLDFSANLFSLQIPFGVTYRPHKNPLFDAFMLKGRLKNCNGVFDRYDLRGTIRHLKKNNIIWYAPDQDYGPDHSVYVPFFGQQAATIVAANRLAKISKAPVLLVRHHRVDANKPYEIEFFKFPDTYPGDDDITDTTYMNQQLEAAIRVHPAQYLWMHKRFKSQPEGKPGSPYIAIKTPRAKIQRSEFDEIIQKAKLIETQYGKNLTYAISDEVNLRVLPAKNSKLFGAEPIRLFDQNAKLLKQAGIQTLTVGTIFKIKNADIKAATYYKLPGVALKAIPLANLPLNKLAEFFVKLHDEGFVFRKIDCSKLFFENEIFHIENPEEVIHYPTSICYADRYANIKSLLNNFEISQQERKQFLVYYQQHSGLENVKEFTRLFLTF